MHVAETPAPVAPPEHDVLCPLCGYNLRGLPEARCPECGAVFQWEQLRDPEKRLHPYLFEHHPQRNAWSFWKTMLGQLRPWTFWKSLSPAQPSQPNRIVLYWLICIVLALAMIAARYAADIHQLGIESARERAAILALMARSSGPASKPYYDYQIQRYGSVQQWLDAEYPLPHRPGFYSAAAGIGRFANYRDIPVPHAVDLLIIAAIAFAWPWLSVLTFMIFRITLRRARIGTSHIMRMAIYSADVVLWVGLLSAPAVVIAMFSPAATPRIGPLYFAVILSVLALPIGWLVYAIRLWVACRRYLQIRHALATVISVQIIVALLIPASIQIGAWLLQAIGIL